MPRWLLLALTPTTLVIGHYVGVLAVEEIKGSADDYSDGYGATAVQRSASGYASALAALVILGTTVYVGSLFGSRADSSPTRSDMSPVHEDDDARRAASASVTSGTFT